MVTMWSTHATAPLNAVYLGYPIGAMISVLIVRSFSHDEAIFDNDDFQRLNTTIIRNKDRFQSSLFGPYTITSVFCLIATIGFALITCKKYQYKKKEKLRGASASQSSVNEEINIKSKSKKSSNKSTIWQKCSPTTCGQGYIGYGFVLMFLLMIWQIFQGKYTFLKTILTAKVCKSNIF